MFTEIVFVLVIILWKCVFAGDNECSCTGVGNVNRCYFPLPAEFADLQLSVSCAGGGAEVDSTNSRPEQRVPLQVLLYTGYFQDDLDWYYADELVERCSIPCQFRRGSSVTDAHDAVVFSLIYLQNPDQVPQRNRTRPGQLFVAHSAESPLNFYGRHLRRPTQPPLGPVLSRFDGFAHPYRDWASVPFNYFHWDLFPLESADGNGESADTLPLVSSGQRTWDRLRKPSAWPAAGATAVPLKAVWFATNCKTPSRREELVLELSNLMQVDRLGPCLFNGSGGAASPDPSDRRRPGWQVRKINQLASYPFTLAFENSEVDDYVTEKLYHPLLAGSIPVYLGASNVADYAPNNSFIHVTGPMRHNAALLFEHLRAIASNVTLFQSYHQWRGQSPFPAHLARWWAESPNSLACRLCQWVSRHSPHKQLAPPPHRDASKSEL